jgi:hypothetical protein
LVAAGSSTQPGKSSRLGSEKRREEENGEGALDDGLEKIS